MKTLFGYLFLAGLLFKSECGLTEGAQNPNFELNPQDVPVFYENNPLTGLKTAMLITAFSIKNMDMHKKMRQIVEQSLSKMGEVVQLKDADMRGFGSGNILLIQMDNVMGWDGKELPVSRISLCVESPVTLDQTGMKTLPMLWSINSFLQGSLDSISEENLTEALQRIVNEFAKNYQHANQSLAKRPVFYVYSQTT